jgi:hypothetical protein
MLHQLFPEKFLPLSIRNVKGIYDNRYLLKQLLPNDFSINYILDLIIEAVEKNQRLRTLECLKVIKNILRNNPFLYVPDSNTVSKLFLLFKRFVFHKNDDICSCVNMLIWNRYLKNEEVYWLISNWQRSEHILNRILRYPEINPLIVEWAKDNYQANELTDRKTELSAILIEDKESPFVNKIDEMAIWAIYYSRLPDEAKQNKLIENYSEITSSAIWEVARRLAFQNVIEYMKTKVKAKYNV